VAHLKGGEKGPISFPGRGRKKVLNNYISWEGRKKRGGRGDVHVVHRGNLQEKGKQKVDIPGGEGGRRGGGKKDPQADEVSYHSPARKREKILAPPLTKKGEGKTQHTINYLGTDP